MVSSAIYYPVVFTSRSTSPASATHSGLASSMDALMIMEAAAAEDLLADAATSHQGSSTSVPPATAAPGAVGGVAGDYLHEHVICSLLLLRRQLQQPLVPALVRC
jgi:hypothetical protein